MIHVGIKHKYNNCTSTVWYRAHSMNRHPNGKYMVAFGNDDQRTPYQIPMRLFAGVAGADFANGDAEISEWTT